MRELVDNAMLADSEHHLHLLKVENVTLKEQVIRQRIETETRQQQYAKDGGIEAKLKVLKGKKDRYKGIVVQQRIDIKKLTQDIKDLDEQVQAFKKD